MALRIVDKIQQLPPEACFFSLEFFPPKTPAGTQNLLPRLTRLAKLNPLFVTVTWGAGGSTAAKSLDLAEITQQQYGLTTCLHLTCTNMRQRVLDEALQRCKEIGVRNLLALRGDEPRPGEYAEPDDDGGGAEEKFEYAVDLVRYIRKHHGDYFCIGVAAYPEGHAASSYAPVQDPLHDMPYLEQKTRAGADFLMTQLFYDTEKFLEFEKTLRQHESGVFRDIPIIPGLMPIQSWSTMRRVSNLSCAKVPAPILSRVEAVKTDDEAVKEVGVEILSEMVKSMIKALQPGRKGFHFYTLNLEKAVAQILEKCSFVPDSASAHEDGLTPSLTQGDAKAVVLINGDTSSKTSQKPLSGATTGSEDKVIEKTAALSISVGEGSLGREATWDDFPNGRWGDTRSPAFGSIDGYGPTLHVSRAEAILLWGRPAATADITSIFRRFLTGEISANPWSEEGLSAETSLIRDRLLKLLERGWWTMASQPAVNGVSSGDEVVGWGPKSGGWVWQKPFVEFFLPSKDWLSLRQKLIERADEFTFFAGNARGDFEASDPASVNAVTWGVFKDKEILSPTIIDAESFRSWQDEAFGIWAEWQRVYPATSLSAKLIHEIRSDIWLVNVIGNDFMDENKLWTLLLE